MAKYELGKFEEYNNLCIVEVDPHDIYRSAMLCNHNIPMHYEDWVQADKDSTYFGLYKSQNNTIFINNCITNEEKFIQILRHELTHAFLSYKMPVGMVYDEEELCETFSKHYDEYTNFINKVTDICVKGFQKEYQ